MKLSEGTMRKLLLVLLLVASQSQAADVIKFRKGVAFDHHSHQADKVGICAVCHEKNPGKISGFGKKWAHKYCIECHDLYKEGPTGCGGCHSY